MRLFLLILLSAILLQPNFGVAQDSDLEQFRPNQRHDVQLWTSITARQKIGKHWQWQLTEGYRMDNNISQVKNFLTEATIVYRFNKSFKTSVLYRYTNRGENEADRNRLGLKLYYSKEFDRLSVGYRFYYQHEMQANRLAENLLRSRITIDYNFKGWKIDPYVAVEHFFRIHYKGNETVAMRYTAGVSMGVTKTLDLKLFYRFQQQMNVADPLNTDILGAGLTYTFKRILR